MVLKGERTKGQKDRAGVPRKKNLCQKINYLKISNYTKQNCPIPNTFCSETDSKRLEMATNFKISFESTDKINTFVHYW